MSFEQLLSTARDLVTAFDPSEDRISASKKKWRELVGIVFNMKMEDAQRADKLETLLTEQRTLRLQAVDERDALSSRIEVMSDHIQSLNEMNRNRMNTIVADKRELRKQEAKIKELEAELAIRVMKTPSDEIERLNDQVESLNQLNSNQAVMIADRDTEIRRLTEEIERVRALNLEQAVKISDLLHAIRGTRAILNPVFNKYAL